MLKKIILLTLLTISLFSFGGIANAEDNGGDNDDCIELNTKIPGLEENGCIKKTEASDVFGTLMGGLMKIAINITVAVAFISLIASGIMLAVSGVNQSTAGKGKELLKKVVLGIILIGLSGLILHTINPNFFKTSMIESKSMHT